MSCASGNHGVNKSGNLAKYGRHVLRGTRFITLAALLSAASVAPAAAQDRLCDPAFEACRDVLIKHIREETVGLDVAFWFMEDSWIASEVIARWDAGVPVRVLMDTRANASTPKNADRLAELEAAGIPMRERFAPGILHWKMMLFAGQGLVQFSAANYSPEAWSYFEPYANYVDEAIYFTTKPSVVNSFMTKYDDLWTDTEHYRDYANISVPLWRVYGAFEKDPELNFAPLESYAVRAVDEYYKETQKIDVTMYRITDRRHTDALIDLRQSGLPVRLLTEPKQYRDPARLWHSWNVDRLYMAGVEIKHRAHAGLTHQKSVLLHGQGMTIFGSSNWTSPSAHSQEEHNYFTTDPAIFQWFVDQFERKWNNLAGVEEYEPFTPLPPGSPTLPSPASDATNVSPTNLVLQWDGSPWAHVYDVYLGTSSSRLELVGGNLQLGPSRSTGDLRSFSVNTTLLPGTTYYWRVVGKTMANMTAEGPIWAFTTGDTESTSSGLPAPWASQDVGAVGLAGSASESSGTFTVDASGADVWGTADAFYYVWQPVSGDVDIVGRVASVEQVHAWTKAGVMIREQLGADSAHAFMLVSAGKGLAFQRRLATGGSSTSTAGGSGTAPVWMKLERRDNTISAYSSIDGATWTLVAGDTFTMAADVYVGLALTSHDDAQLATATFDNVTVTAVGSSGNVPPTVSLTSPADGTTFTAPATIDVTASASDSDGTVTQVDFYADATLLASDSGAPYGLRWQDVPAGTYTLTAVATDDSGGMTTSAAVTITVEGAAVALSAPWASQDIGAVGLAGSASENDGTFTLHGAGGDIWGTADAFHYAFQPVSGDMNVVARVATLEHVHDWTKAAVMIRERLTADSAHAMMLVSPGKGLAFQRRVAAGGLSTHTSGGSGTAPAWLKLERRGDTISAYLSDDGVTWTLVGSDTFTMPADVYVGLALTSHDATQLATATFDNVTVATVGSSGNVLPAVSLTSPADGAIFTAPATIELAASASDSDGTVTQVDFYAGTTLLGADTSAPYELTWTDVPAGTYTLTAVAADDAGGTTTSAAVTVTVEEAAVAPSPPWASQDIGAVGLAGSASESDGTFTLHASGEDIWGTADAFHYVSQPVSGDVDVVARVAALEYVHDWTKAAVMIREQLTDDSAHAMMLVSPGKGLAFQRRVLSGGLSTHTSGGSGTAPAWVKLERRGDTISAYRSDDGLSWALVGSDTFTLGADVYVGLAVTSHDNTTLASATFDNVSVVVR